MPLVIHPRIRKAVGRVAATTAVAMFATTGAAFASCTTQASTTPFSQLGDNANYFLAPGGSFESSASQVSWNLNNAALVAGNEPWNVNSSSDGQSLQIGAGGSATSPYFCIDSTMPFFRFFTTQAAGGSPLKVQVLLQIPGWGWQPTLNVLTVPDGGASSWTAQGPVNLANGLPLPSGMAIQAALRFSVPQWGGSAWQIDDVYVDPYRAG